MYCFNWINNGADSDIVTADNLYDLANQIKTEVKDDDTDLHVRAWFHSKRNRSNYPLSQGEIEQLADNLTYGVPDKCCLTVSTF